MGTTNKYGRLFADMQYELKHLAKRFADDSQALTELNALEEKLYLLEEKIGISGNERNKHRDPGNHLPNAVDAPEQPEYYRFLSLVADQNPGAVVITDTSGRITYVNSGFCQITGYTFEEAVGVTPRILKSGIHSDAFYENLWQTIAEGKVWHGEICNKKKDGSLFWGLTSISPVKNPRGEVNHYLSVQQDITELKHLQDKLLRLATTDELTGAANRTRFMELGNKEMERAIRYDNLLSVLSVDIDCFQEVNDSYGHKVGDMALGWFADLVRKVLRDSDILGRLGGDEFAILLPETDAEQACQVAERLQKMLQDNSMSYRENVEITLTVSIGIASRSERSFSLDEMLKKADTALHVAKRLGRNRIQVATIFDNPYGNLVTLKQ